MINIKYHIHIYKDPIKYQWESTTSCTSGLEISFVKQINMFKHVQSRLNTGSIIIMSNFLYCLDFSIRLLI